MKIGQKIYLEPIGNNSRYSKEIKEVTVSKIGRKYFTVEEMKVERFENASLLSDGRGYSPEWRVWLSKDCIEKKNESIKIYAEIRDYFKYSNHKLSIEQLTAIKNIIDNKEV